MKSYESYQDVSSLWVNKIPIHWEFNKLRSIFWQRKEKNDPIKTKEILSLSAKAGVELYSQKAHGGGNKAKDDITKYNIAHTGDLVVNCMNIISGSVGLSKYYGAISPVYYALVTRNENYNRDYYHYLFKIEPFQKSLLPLGRGILMHESSTGKLNTIRMRISMADFNNVYLPVPPCEEQDQIVRYLDWQVSKINHLIHGYQKQIKLLEERKQKQINDVLESGLDTTEKTIQTKATWMGKTPSHWKQYRVKDIMYEVNNRSKDGSEPHLSMSQKYGLVTDDVDIERRLLSESYVGAKICEANDLVLNRLKAHLGVFALAPQLGVVSPDYTVLRIRQERIIPKYAEYLLKCNDCRRELVIRVRGIVEGFWRLYTNDLYGIYICIPDLNEQRHILEFIGNIEEKYNNIKKKLEKEIQLLKEYRTRLISDVVTGQIDVCDVVIPDYTPEEDTEIDTDDTGDDAEEVAEDAE